jgi:hypothetical protein
MTYNIETKRINKVSDCKNCEYMSSNYECSGLDRKCFLCDAKTGICYDSKTKMPINKKAFE